MSPVPDTVLPNLTSLPSFFSNPSFYLFAYLFVFIRVFLLHQFVLFFKNCSNPGFDTNVIFCSLLNSVINNIDGQMTNDID